MVEWSWDSDSGWSWDRERKRVVERRRRMTERVGRWVGRLRGVLGLIWVLDGRGG